MSWYSCRRMRSSHRAMFWWFRNGWAQEISLDLKPDEMRDLLVAVQKAAIAQKNGLEQRVSEFNKITGSAAAKPFTMPIFTSYPLSEEKRLELLRQGESCRRRNITR